MDGTRPQTVIAVPTKSMGIAIILTILFGPLGMLYATIPGAIVMFILKLLAFVLTAGLGLILLWPIAVVWSAMAVKSHNDRLIAGERRD